MITAKVAELKSSIQHVYTIVAAIMVRADVQTCSAFLQILVKVDKEVPVRLSVIPGAIPKTSQRSPKPSLGLLEAPPS